MPLESKGMILVVRVIKDLKIKSMVYKKCPKIMEIN